MKKLDQKSDISVSSILSNPNSKTLLSNYKTKSIGTESKTEDSCGSSDNKFEKIKEEDSPKERIRKISNSEELSDNVREFFINAATLTPLRRDSASSTTSTITKQDLQKVSEACNKNELSQKENNSYSSDDGKKNENKHEKDRREERPSRRIRNKVNKNIKYLYVLNLNIL